MTHNNKMRCARLLSETEQFILKLKSDIHGRDSDPPERGVITPTLARFEKRLISLLPSLPMEYQDTLALALEKPLNSVPLTYQENLKWNRIIEEWATVVENERVALEADCAAAMQSLRPLLLRMWDARIAKIFSYYETRKRKGEEDMARWRNDICQINPESLAQIQGEIPRMDYGAAQLDLTQVNLEQLLQPAEAALRKAFKDHEEGGRQVGADTWRLWRSLKLGLTSTSSSSNSQ